VDLDLRPKDMGGLGLGGRGLGLGLRLATMGLDYISDSPRRVLIGTSRVRLQIATAIC